MKNLKGSAVNKSSKLPKNVETFYNVFKEKFIFFALKKLKKNTLKSCPEKLKSIFFLTALSCPIGPNRRIHIPKCGQNIDQLYIKLGSKPLT